MYRLLRENNVPLCDYSNARAASRNEGVDTLQLRAKGNSIYSNTLSPFDTRATPDYTVRI